MNRRKKLRRKTSLKPKVARVRPANRKRRAANFARAYGGEYADFIRSLPCLFSGAGCGGRVHLQSRLDTAIKRIYELESANAELSRRLLRAPTRVTDAMVEAAYRAHNDALDAAVAKTGEVRPGDRALWRAGLTAALAASPASVPPQPARPPEMPE